MNVISIKEILNLYINILINFIVAVNVLWSQQIFPILYEKKIIMYVRYGQRKNH